MERHEDVIIANIHDRLCRIIDELQLFSHDPEMDMTYNPVLYQLDSVCRDILSLQNWIHFPNDFVKCVTDGYQILKGFFGNRVMEFQTVDHVDDHQAQYLTGLVGRPRFHVTFDQLVLLLGNYKAFLLTRAKSSIK